MTWDDLRTLSLSELGNKITKNDKGWATLKKMLWDKFRNKQHIKFWIFLVHSRFFVDFGAKMAQKSIKGGFHGIFFMEIYQNFQHTRFSRQTCLRFCIFLVHSRFLSILGPKWPKKFIKGPSLIRGGWHGIFIRRTLVPSLFHSEIPFFSNRLS